MSTFIYGALTGRTAATVTITKEQAIQKIRETLIDLGHRVKECPHTNPEWCAYWLQKEALLINQETDPKYSVRTAEPGGYTLYNTPPNVKSGGKYKVSQRKKFGKTRKLRR